MGDPLESAKIEAARLAAYGKARPLLEPYQHDPRVLAAAVEVAWEFLAEGNRLFDLTRLLREGMGHLSLCMQKFEDGIIESADPAARETPRVVIAWSGGRREAPCAICGSPYNSVDVGPELYMEGTNDAVCDACGMHHAPALMQFVHLVRNNKQFVSVLKQYRDEAERRPRDF